MERLVNKSTFGSALLVAGCCIGAGMLGLPLVCQPCGFFGSILPLMIGWIYMYFSGLMLLEVHSKIDSKLTLLKLFQAVLGNRAMKLGAFLFYFLFSSILTAYLNAFSVITKNTVDSIFHLQSPEFLALFGICIGLVMLMVSGIEKIDPINRVLVMCMLLFYVLLIFFGVPQIRAENLAYFSFKTKPIVLAIPIFMVSFGFQNLIPLISQHVSYNELDVKKALFWGTVLAFVVYFVWNYIVLGIVSPATKLSSINSLFSENGDLAGICMSGFGLIAIVTSLITVALSFSNFVSHSSDDRLKKVRKAMVIIAIPAVSVFFNPNLFLLPLHIAGGIAAVSLFGLFPVVMLWKIRYRQFSKPNLIFPFGKTALIFYACFSLCIIAIEIAHIFKFYQ